MKTLPGLLFADILVFASFGSLVHGLTTVTSVTSPLHHGLPAFPGYVPTPSSLRPGVHSGQGQPQPDHGGLGMSPWGNQTVGLPDHCHCKVSDTDTDVIVFPAIPMPDPSNEKCARECLGLWSNELNQGDLNAGPGQFLCHGLEQNGTPIFGPATVYLYFQLLYQPWIEIPGTQSKQPLSCYYGNYIYSHPPPTRTE